MTFPTFSASAPGRLNQAQRSPVHLARVATLRRVCLGAWLGLALLGAGLGGARAQEPSAKIVNFALEQLGDEVALSATLQFALSDAVEEALLKGISVIFVAQAEVLRERWYWRDEKLVSAERHMRLAYQPLIRRWRLSVTSGALKHSGWGLALNQSFDTLQEALAAVRRLSRWQIASRGELDAQQPYRVDFRFYLDLAQLPRPLQIGSVGQSDWVIAAQTSRPLVLQAAK